MRHSSLYGVWRFSSSVGAHLASLQLRYNLRTDVDYGLQLSVGIVYSVTPNGLNSDISALQRQYVRVTSTYLWF